MKNLKWKRCDDLGTFFAVDTWKGEKYLLCKPIEEGESAAVPINSLDEIGQVEECAIDEKPILVELFPDDLDALDSVIFF